MRRRPDRPTTPAAPSPVGSARPDPDRAGGRARTGEVGSFRVESRSPMGDDRREERPPHASTSGWCAMPLDLLTRLDPLRRIRCPFCFEKFAACEMHLRCDDHYCKTDFGRMIDDPILSRALNGPRYAGDTSGSTLRSPWWVDPRSDRRRGFRRRLDWMVLPDSLTCPNCKKPTDVRLCPRCHSQLPESVVTLDAGHIAI